MTATILFFLLLAPEAGAQTAEVVELLKEDKAKEALALLQEIGKLEGDHAEAKALVKMIRDGKLQKAYRAHPEVLEEAFRALQGIKSRKATRGLLALLDHSVLKKNDAIRIGVCRALQGSADPKGVEALLDLMRDPSDHVVAAAGEAAGAYRYAKESIRKDLFETVLGIYESTWNLKNSVKSELKKEKRRAEAKWEIIEAPMEKTLGLLSNVTQKSPPDWRRWWNKNKRRKWAELEN